MYLYKNTLVYLSDNRQIVYYDLRNFDLLDESTVVAASAIFAELQTQPSVFSFTMWRGYVVCVLASGKGFKFKLKTKSVQDSSSQLVQVAPAGTEFVGVKAVGQYLLSWGIHPMKTVEIMKVQSGMSVFENAVVELRTPRTFKRYSSLQLKCQIFSGSRS